MVWHYLHKLGIDDMRIFVLKLSKFHSVVTQNGVSALILECGFDLVCPYFDFHRCTDVRRADPKLAWFPNKSDSGGVQFGSSGANLDVKGMLMVHL